MNHSKSNRGGLREKKTGQADAAVQRNCLSHVRSNGHVFLIGESDGQRTWPVAALWAAGERKAQLAFHLSISRCITRGFAAPVFRNRRLLPALFRRSTANQSESGGDWRRK